MYLAVYVCFIFLKRRQKQTVVSRYTINHKTVPVNLGTFLSYLKAKRHKAYFVLVYIMS